MSKASSTADIGESAVKRCFFFLDDADDDVLRCTSSASMRCDGVVKKSGKNEWVFGGERYRFLFLKIHHSYNEKYVLLETRSK